MLKQKKILNKYIIIILISILTLTSVYSPVYAKSVNTISSLDSIKPPSKVASSIKINIKPINVKINNVQNEVYKDVYSKEDQKLAILGEKIDEAEAPLKSDSKNDVQRFSISSEQDNSKSISSSQQILTLKQMEDLVTSGAELIDIYWITYLYQQTSIDPIELWTEYQANLSWEEIEKKVYKSVYI